MLFSYDRGDLEEALAENPRQVEDELRDLIREVQREVLSARVQERRAESVSAGRVFTDDLTPS